MSDDAVEDATSVRSGLPWALLQSDTGELHPIRGPTFTIGRFRDNDLILNTASSSNFHAVLTCDADGIWSVSDRGSSNGTLLNSSRLTPNHPYVLHLSDLLKFTKSFDPAPEFCVVLDPNAAVATQPLSDDASAVADFIGSEAVSGGADRTLPSCTVDPNCQEDPTTVIALSVTATAAAADDTASIDNSANICRGEISRKRLRSEDPRPNLAKIDDYRCVICGELPLAATPSVEADLDLVQVVPCCHHFHRGCITLWLEARPGSSTCPSCRARVDRVVALSLIHQHAAILRQEREYETALQPDVESDDVDHAAAALIREFRRFRPSRCGSGPTTFDSDRQESMMSATTFFLGRLSRLANKPLTALHALGEVFRGIFEGDADLAFLYETDSLPNAVGDVVGELVRAWVKAALSLESHDDSPPPNALTLTGLLPHSLADIVTASLRPGTCTARDPPLIARARTDALLAQNRPAEAAAYAGAQGLYGDACRTWAGLGDVQRLIGSGYIAHLSWSDRVQIADTLRECPGTSDGFVLRFVRAVFDSDPKPIGDDDVTSVRSLLVAYVRAAPRSSLRRVLVDCARVVSAAPNTDLMFGLLEQLSSINPTASAFLACEIISVVAKRIPTRDLDVASLMSSSDSDPGLGRLLQLVVTIVARHGDTERQDSLADILTHRRLQPPLIFALSTALINVGVRGHALAWRLLRAADLSGFTDPEISNVSNIVQQLDSGGVVDLYAAPDVFLALFKRRPSRANFARIRDVAVRCAAFEWLQTIPPSDLSLESVSLLIDNAPDTETVGSFISDIILHDTFRLAHDTRFYCHLIPNRRVQAWLVQSPSVAGTTIVTICGRLLAEGVLVDDGTGQAALQNVVDDVPEALSARIYESACRSALVLYDNKKVSTRAKRNVIRSWIQRLRSLCLFSNDKARWTGFQNSAMRKLKSTDRLYRELKSAGLFNAVV